MAGRGPAPKDPATRRRRNAPSQPAVVLDATDAELRGPELPAECDWPAQTRRWWETWRTSPQAQALTATDWDFLLDTALLHAELWSGNGGVAAELRLRVAKFGATPEDRARLRMEIESPAAKSAEKPASRYAHLRAVHPA